MKNKVEENNHINPVVVINLPVKTSKEKFDEVLNVLGIVETPLPPLEEINQINLEITIENGGQTNE